MKFLLIPGVGPGRGYFNVRYSFEDLVKLYHLDEKDCLEGDESILWSEERVILRVRPFGDYLDYKARRLNKVCPECGEVNHTYFIPSGLWKCRRCDNEWRRNENF